MQVAERSGLVITQGLPVYEEMDGHHEPAPIYLSPETLPGVPFRIAVVDAAQLVGSPHADLHVHHEHDEIYLVATAGCRFTVETDADRVELASPASILIPAGTPHRLVVHAVETDTCPFLGILVEPLRHSPRGSTEDGAL
jgi:mannose-6-phosphate isomerase-like protein (cupin superfamily)